MRTRVGLFGDCEAMRAQRFAMLVSFVNHDLHLYPDFSIYEEGKARYRIGGLGIGVSGNGGCL